MPVCHLRPATLEDSEAVYKLICELKQRTFPAKDFERGFAHNLQNPRIHYLLALLDGEAVGMAGLHLQYHLHHLNWIAEIQELVVLPAVRGMKVGSQLLAWVEEQARQAGAEVIELSTSVQRLNAHRFYLREGYQQSHLRFTKTL